MDVELVRQAQGGDRQAFTALVERVLPRLLGAAHRILRDAALAEDAAQQALLLAWRDLPTLRDPARFDAWVYRTLVRACYDEGRRRRRWRLPLFPGANDAPRAADDLQGVHDRDEVERAMQRLSVEHRTVLVLRYYLDLTLEQIAELLDLPLGTANSRMHRAQSALRASLEADRRGDTRPKATEAT